MTKTNTKQNAKLKNYLIEREDDQDVIQAQNYQEALKIACEMYNIYVSDVTKTITSGKKY